jgi:hypothetical protein
MPIRKQQANKRNNLHRQEKTIETAIKKTKGKNKTAPQQENKVRIQNNRSIA